METLKDIIDFLGEAKYVVLALLCFISALIIILWVAGFFDWLVLNYQQMAKDNATGILSITNQARIWAFAAWFFVWITSKYDVMFSPFHITPHPPDVEETIVILAFVAGIYYLQQRLKQPTVITPAPVNIDSQDTTVQVQAPAAGGTTQAGTVITHKEEENQPECPAARAALEAEKSKKAPFVAYPDRGVAE